MPCGHSAGASTKSARRTGSSPSPISRLSVLFAAKSSLVSSVMGWFFSLLSIALKLILLKYWPSLGSDSRCHHHVSRSLYVDCLMVLELEWLGHLLCLVALLLWCRSWW